MLAFATKTYDYRVYDLVYEKSYQILKFEYLSKFLISEDFMKIEKGTTKRRGSSDKVSNSVWLTGVFAVPLLFLHTDPLLCQLQVIDMRALLVEERAFSCIRRFIVKDDKFSEYLPYLTSWERIHHFVLDYDKMKPANQNKKAKDIFEKVMQEIKMPSHL